MFLGDLSVMDDQPTPQTTIDHLVLKTKKITQWVKKGMFWSLPIKLMTGGILAAIGGSSFIGFLSEYATYLYAISYGIRPPLEGVPYLKAGVTITSMLLLFGAAILFCSIIGLFKFFLLCCRLVSWTISHLPPSWRKWIVGTTDINDFFQSRSFWLKWGAALLVGFSIYLFLKFLNAFNLFGRWNHEDFEYISIMYSVFALFAFVTLIQPSALKWVAVTGAVLYFLAWIVFLFNATYYAYFLRYIGYGGGLPISIELKDGRLPSIEAEKLYLIIRTTNAVIALDRASNKFIEVPNDQIRAIEHNVGGLNHLSDFLPDIAEQRESLFNAELKATRQKSH